MGAATQPMPFGKYFLLERIATGGMAEIFKAKYRAEGGFEKTLVIKRILPHLAQDEEFITMFRDEARLTVRLSHANIVQVFDFGRHGEDYFLAMEYVQGQNLRGVMKRCQELGAPVPIPFALFAMAEIAKGLSYAHSRKDDSDQSMGIVHRDVTPSNVLVSYEGEIKIADFGIAKAASRATGTQAGMIKGKAAYLAPEQVLGKPNVDGRADLFALGAVFWEMVVGKKLFTGDTDFEIMRKITDDPIPVPSAVNAAIPPEIDRVAMKLLERDPAKRYANAATVQKDISVLLAQFGGSVTTVDISAFLRRLFRKEVELEKEASKSFRMPIVDGATVTNGAEEGATLLGAGKSAAEVPARESEIDDYLPTVKKAPLRMPLSVLAIGGAFVLALGVFVGKKALDSKGGAVAATPTAKITSLVVVETPAPTPTTAATEETPKETPAATPVRTEIAVASTPRATPKPTAKATAKALATPAPTAVAAGGFGVLKLDSQPWGEIYVDGKKINRQTPAFDIKLPAGRHEIKLVNPVQKLGATFSVFIEADKPTKMAVKLQPLN